LQDNFLKYFQAFHGAFYNSNWHLLGRVANP